MSHYYESLISFFVISDSIFLISHCLVIKLTFFIPQGTGSLLDVALYNITADPTEHEDLSEKLPDVVKALQARVQYYTKGAVPSLYRPSDPKAFIKAALEGVWTPWED